MDMNIILLPDGLMRGHKISFSHKQVIVLFLTGIIYLPLFFGFIGLEIRSMLRADSEVDVSMLAQQRVEVLKLKNELTHTRIHAETHLNALAQRMGRMQAQLMRLDALGARLTSMADINNKEFDFSSSPALGGPAQPQSRDRQVDVLHTLDQLKESLEEKSEYLAALESLLMDRNLTASVTPSGWPARGGWISSRYGPRADPFTGALSNHDGIDIAAGMGTPILAMADGVVSWSGDRSGYGITVEITHGQGYTTRYAHAQAALVNVGDRVIKGQPIAKVGSSGRSTGPHLHVEVRRNGRAVNPAPYLSNK